jgi:hypothetical protein
MSGLKGETDAGDGDGDGDGDGSREGIVSGSSDSQFTNLKSNGTRKYH